MRAFVEMRRFIANNALLFERISNVELKQLEYQKKTDEKLEQIFEYISDIVFYAIPFRHCYGIRIR